MRKNGIVGDFTSCRNDYLQLINDDLKLHATLDQMIYIQNLYKNERFDPTVADLYFDIYAIKNSINSSKAVKVYEIKSSNKSIVDIWERLVSSFREAGIGNETAPPSLIEIAEYSATGGIHPEGITVNLSFGNSPSVPCPGKNTVSFFCSNGLFLSISEGKAVRYIQDGSSGILISPKSCSSFPEYTRRLHRLAGYIYEKYNAGFIVPMTGKGLVFDIADHINGATFDASFLSSNDSSEAEVFLNPFVSSAMIFLPQSGIPDAESASECEGFTCVPLLSCIGGMHYYLKCGIESVTKTKNFLNKLSVSRPISMNAEENDLSGKGECQVISETVSDVSAISLSGNPYDALAKNCGSHWAIGGTLCPDDPSVIPFIVSMDAFRRNNSLPASAAAFHIGKKTEITVFSF